MRMGFRPVVNMSAPLGANINSIFSSTTSRPFINPFLNQSAFTVDNHHHHQQPSAAKDQTNDLDDPDLQVELENKQLWDAFHSNGTEMVSDWLNFRSDRSFFGVLLGDHQEWKVRRERSLSLCFCFFFFRRIFPAFKVKVTRSQSPSEVRLSHGHSSG